MRRLREESGFGLVELLIAMAVLNIAILATVAAFSSGMLALSRANKTATAAVLADVQMEELRAIRYCDIRLKSAALDATHTDDPEYTSDPALVDPPNTGCPASPVTATDPIQQDPAAPDNRRYRLDVYMRFDTPAPGARQLKRVTIVVRDASQSPMRVLTRQTSTFEEATG